MTMRWWVGAMLLPLAASACDGCKKDPPPHPSTSGSGSAKAYEPPMVLGIDASGPVIPPPRPLSSTAVIRPSAVPSDAPGVCKSDADCPVKAGTEQLCCISTTQPGGPGLFCQDRPLPCQRPCVTDADCRVAKRCDIVKGTPSGVVLRGCF